MNITPEQQHEYIDKVALRVIGGDLDRKAGLYRIDAMVECVPSLKEHASQAIDKIYKWVNND